MDFSSFALTALAVTIGMVVRDFIMGALVSWQTKQAAEKKAKQLDAYYQALLDAEANVEADADAS